MVSTVQKIQDKLFGKSTTAQSTSSDANIDQQQLSSPSERVDPSSSLSINIPKANSSTNLVPPKKSSKLGSEDDDGPEATTPPLRTYRERLIERLGDKYKGVEKYRLEQDAKRERHWKRWGPYLSDRQWVSVQNRLSRFDWIG